MILPQFQNFTYRHLVKPVFFRFDPERVHDGMQRAGRMLGKLPPARAIFRFLFAYNHPSLRQTIDGLDYKNPVGLSAGFDKDAEFLQLLPHVGFGFTQVGSVTYGSYGGNPKPRLHRLLKSKGLVVYYGLKNIGVKSIIAKIKNMRLPKDFRVSISVAKTNNESTAKEQDGIDDYVATLVELESENIGDLYTINISCPNTFGGEPFTTPEKLERLLTSIDKLEVTKPVYVKMPINIEWQEFRLLLEVIRSKNVQGVVIGNLNKNHDDPLIQDPIPAGMKGGISGLPTKQLCNDLIAKTYQEYGDELTIVGVGGIFTAEDAYEKIQLGASLVQLITGMIFEGPQLIGQINKGLVELLKQDGYSNISEAIGTKTASV